MCIHPDMKTSTLREQQVNNIALKQYILFNKRPGSVEIQKST